LGRLSPEVWERVKAIEREINRSVLTKDTDGLRKNLEAYVGDNREGAKSNRDGSL